MRWEVLFHDRFREEFRLLEAEVRLEFTALVGALEQMGPHLSRPRADTLKGSRHANMKELRFSAAGGEWRTAYAFDPVRRAIILVAGDKSGGSERLFYKRLLRVADERFSEHLKELNSRKGN
jgi:hypothetical protein